MKYAYISKAGILRIVESKKTAAEYARNSRVIETNLPGEHGYPLYGGRRVFMYSAEEIYIGGNERTGKRIGPEDVPGLAELYKSLM